MGFKRPLDDNKFHELPFKHSRQLGFNEKSMQFEEFIPRHVASQSPLATVNARPQVGETFDEESSFVYPGLDMEGCFDLCHGKDATHPAEYFELGLVPPRTLDPFETFYSVLLDQPARKQVPIGPDHQAILPEWEGSVNTNLEPLATSKLSGTCVVPMPALNMPDDSVGKGREFCVCQDMGSIRCVRQHVKEAREEVVKVHGFEKFRDLGFCDMGEEVTERWSDEDELLFHEVVYSNPVTLGRNFWKHLEAAFLSRTKHEIVSYYFNVFVLRRRATQNRSMMLDIDSDDDEWHGGYGGRPLGTQYDEGHEEEEEEEEDSVIQSPLHQGTERYNEKVHPLYEREGEEDASISDNDEDDTRLLDEHKMDAAVEYMSTFFVCNEERLNVEDDSCTTLELAHDAVNSGWKKCANKEETGLEDEQKKVERV